MKENKQKLHCTPKLKEWFENNQAKEPDFDEYLKQCPPLSVINQINDVWIWLDEQHQDFYGGLLDELISPKKWLRQRSVMEYLTYLEYADSSEREIILMSQSISESFFNVFGQSSRAHIIVIYDNKEQSYRRAERDSSLSIIVSSNICRCINLQIASESLTMIIVLRLMDYGDECDLDHQKKRLAKEYYRKALEKLSGFENFMGSAQMQQLSEKYIVCIYAIQTRICDYIVYE